MSADLCIYEGYLFFDVRAWLRYGGVPPSFRDDGNQVLLSIAAGTWEVGQAYRLMLTLFFVTFVCLHSGLDMIQLLYVCAAAVFSFVGAEFCLFRRNDSVRASSIEIEIEVEEARSRRK